MGFRCAISGKHIMDKPRRVIAKRREVQYPERWGWVKSKRFDGEEGRPEWKVIDPGGKGWEIEKEILVDPNTPQTVLDKFLGQQNRHRAAA